MSKENEEGKDPVDWKNIAEALARDLVEMSASVRTVLKNSTFNFNVIDEVKLLEATTADVLNTYVEQTGEEESEQENA